MLGDLVNHFRYFNQKKKKKKKRNKIHTLRMTGSAKIA